MQTILITAQFALSIALIAATLVVTRQIHFLRIQDMGLDREHVLTMKILPTDMHRYYEPFKNALLQNSDILSVSKSGREIGEAWPANPIRLENQDWAQAKQIVGNWVDYDYLSTIGAQLQQGRTFSATFAGDSLNSIILNEAAVAMLGLVDPIGRRVDYFSNNTPRTIIGVVKDFNHASLHHNIEPMALIMPFTHVENLLVRIAPGDPGTAIAAIHTAWESIAPGIPLDIHFMDTQLNNLYQNEEKLSVLIRGFSILAVLLACLGLYALVSIMINNRMKEVGVRKILGATVPSLVFMFSQHYILLMGAATFFATPAMYFILQQWLHNFAFKIQLTILPFLFAGALALGIAMLTISWQAIKTAIANPVDALRYE